MRKLSFVEPGMILLWCVKCTFLVTFTKFRFLLIFILIIHCQYSLARMIQRPYETPIPTVFENVESHLRFIKLQPGLEIIIDETKYHQSGLYSMDKDSEPLYIFDNNEWLYALSNDGRIYVTVTRANMRDLRYNPKLQEPYEKSGESPLEAYKKDKLDIHLEAYENARHIQAYLKFFKNGNLIKKYHLQDLVTDTTQISTPTDVFDFGWTGKIKIDRSRDILYVETVDKNLYLFDISTGEILSASMFSLDNYAATIIKQDGSTLDLEQIHICKSIFALMAETQNINDLSIAGFLESEKKDNDNVTSLVVVPFQDIDSINRLDKNDLSFNVSLKNGSSVKLKLEGFYQLCSKDSNKNRIQLSINDIESINSFKLLESEDTENQYPNPTKLQLDYFDKGQITRPWKRREEGTYTIIDHNIRKIIGNQNHGIPPDEIVWKPILSGRECTDKLAGYGKRAKAICFDMIYASMRGPLMVVVPSSSEFQNGFAIGKYEVSVSDYSKYCEISGNCAPVKDKNKHNDPLRGISVKDAETYAKWLTERIGKPYRLPTQAEWGYAANASGKQPKKDFNCNVALGKEVIKESTVISAKRGKSNGWGLKNYVGNVQEWVIEFSGKIMVAGGYFDTDEVDCNLDYINSHDGNADDHTGFRVLMEMK